MGLLPLTALSILFLLYNDRIFQDAGPRLSPLDFTFILVCELISPFHDVANLDTGDDKSSIRGAYGHKRDVL